MYGLYYLIKFFTYKYITEQIINYVISIALKLNYHIYEIFSLTWAPTAWWMDVDQKQVLGRPWNLNLPTHTYYLPVGSLHLFKEGTAWISKSF